MRAVIQRVSKASVIVDELITGQIEKGLLVLLGIEDADTVEDIEWLSNKIVNLRIFDDENKVPNIAVKDMGGDIGIVLKIPENDVIYVLASLNKSRIVIVRNEI